MVFPDPGSSLATQPNDVSWARRPVLGWIVRVVAIGLPVMVSFGIAWFLTNITPTPVSFWIALVRWIVIAILSSSALIVLERGSRRMLPIATLFDLSLVFPDRAPSRFRVAMRTGTTAQLRRRIDEAKSGAATDTPAESAARVIELVAALRIHDRITRGHSERVRAYAQMIAEEMNLSAPEMDRLRWAALLHDIGKLLVPTSILNKTSRLTDAEFDLIKAHPENGRQIIAPLIPWLGDSASAVWQHHEKWDGSGYPNQISGTDISLAARIVAVADVYDVLTSTRSYKGAISPKEARLELARCAGTHFDPTVVRAFLNLSIGQVRRAAGPLSWLAQAALFPTAVLGSTQAASAAFVVTGSLAASSMGASPEAFRTPFEMFDDGSAVTVSADEMAAADEHEPGATIYVVSESTFSAPLAVESTVVSVDNAVSTVSTVAAAGAESAPSSDTGGPTAVALTSPPRPGDAGTPTTIASSDDPTSTSTSSPRSTSASTTSAPPSSPRVPGPTTAVPNPTPMVTIPTLTIPTSLTTTATTTTTTTTSTTTSTTTTMVEPVSIVMPDVTTPAASAPARPGPGSRVPAVTTTTVSALIVTQPLATVPQVMASLPALPTTAGGSGGTGGNGGKSG